VDPIDISSYCSIDRKDGVICANDKDPSQPSQNGFNQVISSLPLASSLERLNISDIIAR